MRVDTGPSSSIRVPFSGVGIAPSSLSNQYGKILSGNNQNGDRASIFFSIVWPSPPLRLFKFSFYILHETYAHPGSCKLKIKMAN